MDCIFCKIVNKEIDTNILYEDDKILIFNDIEPKAPVHFLAIPKKHIESANDINEENNFLIGHIYKVIAELAKKFNVEKSGYRIVNNCGNDGEQSTAGGRERNPALPRAVARRRARQHRHRPGAGHHAAAADQRHGRRRERGEADESLYRQGGRELVGGGRLQGGAPCDAGGPHPRDGAMAAKDDAVRRARGDRKGSEHRHHRAGGEDRNRSGRGIREVQQEPLRRVLHRLLAL